jgi:hypothetical protein
MDDDVGVQQCCLSRFMSWAREGRLALLVVGLYSTFLFWGYLQEKLTATTYECHSKGGNEKRRWAFSALLNGKYSPICATGYRTNTGSAACMALTCTVTAAVPIILSGKRQEAPFASFSMVSTCVHWCAHIRLRCSGTQAALTCALGSPIGCKCRSNCVCHRVALI